MENNFSINISKEDKKILDEASSHGTHNHKTSSMLVSNYRYIEWLSRFCQNHPYFCDDDWDYYPIPLSLEEYENVKCLKLFYNSILDYAKENHYNIDDGIIFIKFDRIAFELGKTSANRYHAYYCRRKDISGTHEFINFDDIIYHVTH